MENSTISEGFQEWNDRRLELKQISNAAYLRYKQVFNRHYHNFGDKKIKTVAAEEFLEEEAAEELTAKAFALLKTVTRGFIEKSKEAQVDLF